MTIPIMQEQRDQLMTRAREAVDDNKLDEFEKIKGDITALDKRISAQQFVDSAKLSKAKEPADKANSTRIAKEYDLGKALRCAMSGRFEGLEGEVQSELRSNPANSKHVTNAVLVPDELLQTRAITGATIGANTLTESFRPQEFLPSLRDRTIAGALGIRMISGTGDKIKIPRQSGTTTASWVAETGAVSATDMQFQVPLELEAKRLSYHTSHSDQIIRESGGGLPIQSIIIEEGQRALALEVDKRIFYTATTAPTSGPAPIFKNGTNGGAVSASTQSGTSTNGKTPTYLDLLALIGSPEDANLPMMRPGWAINFKTYRKYKVTRKLDASTDSVTIANNNQLDGYPTQISNIVPSNLAKGTGTGLSAMFYSSDWQYLILATWGSTALIVDPYSKADESTVRLIWHQFMDFKVTRENAFAWYSDVITT